MEWMIGHAVTGLFWYLYAKNFERDRENGISVVSNARTDVLANVSFKVAPSQPLTPNHVQTVLYFQHTMLSP